MKYILLDDIKYIIGKNKKIILSYVAALVLLLFAYMFLSYTETKMIPLKIFGLDLDFNEFNWLTVLSYSLSVLVYILITIKLFLKDMAGNSENIFLRISKKRWVSYKLLSIICSTTLYMLVCYLLVFALIFIIKKALVFDLVTLYLKNLIYVITFEIIVIFVYCIVLKRKWLLLVITSIPIILCIIYFNLWSIIDIRYGIFSSISLLIYVLIYKYLSINITPIFEIIKEK